RGNHSPTMYPDLFNAKVKGERAWDAVGDESWVADEFIPRVGKRGAEIIEARGATSAVPEGIISSFPCRTSGGEWEIVQGLDVPDFSQERIDRTVAELQGERDAVR